MVNLRRNMTEWQIYFEELIKESDVEVLSY